MKQLIWNLYLWLGNLNIGTSKSYLKSNQHWSLNSRRSPLVMIMSYNQWTLERSIDAFIRDDRRIALKWNNIDIHSSALHLATIASQTCILLRTTLERCEVAEHMVHKSISSSAMDRCRLEYRMLYWTCYVRRSVDSHKSYQGPYETQFSCTRCRLSCRSNFLSLKYLFAANDSVK